MLELDTISIVVSGGGYVADPPGEGTWIFGALGQSGLALPVSLSLCAGTGDGFTVDVTAVAHYLGTNLVQRNASGVRSARGERRMLAMPLLRKCACKGTNCPADPDCRTLIEPVLKQLKGS